MIFIENLDHNPQAVTLEKLPDGTAWLYLRKDAPEMRTRLRMESRAVLRGSAPRLFASWVPIMQRKPWKASRRRLMIGGSMQKHGRPLMKLRPLWKSV